MKNIYRIFIAIVLFLSLCEKKEPDIGEPVGNNVVVSIKFGKKWDAESQELEEIDTLFSYGIRKIYYEIKFENTFPQGVILKKKWKRDGDSILSVVSFIPWGKERICGEFHYYDTLSNVLDAGKYELFIYYWDMSESVYKRFPYADTVVPRFRIQ